ncbi:MAG: hypothetical protein R6U98_03560 [Pirellulaceae bacterium]
MARQTDRTGKPVAAGGDRAARIHWWLLSFMQLAMAASLAMAIYEQQWLTAALVLGIFALMAVPAVLGRRFTLHIPAEFELVALVFVFAALFLGEVRGYYHRFWWWDIALHTTSGLLLGILGFLLIYVLNKDERIELHLLPRFVALFAFLFAVSVGAMWEIFEFAMDEVFGTNMQKPMLGDPSGKTDTMWDLIVDTVAAAVISSVGWWYIRKRQRSFIESWIRKFIERNPHFFRKEVREEEW